MLQIFLYLDIIERDKKCCTNKWDVIPYHQNQTAIKNEILALGSCDLLCPALLGAAREREVRNCQKITGDHFSTNSNRLIDKR